MIRFKKNVDIAHIIKKAIYDWKVRTGKSEKEFVEKIDLSQSQITKIKRTNEANPTISTLIDLSNALEQNLLVELLELPTDSFKEPYTFKIDNEDYTILGKQKGMYLEHKFNSLINENKLLKTNVLLTEKLLKTFDNS